MQLAIQIGAYLVGLPLEILVIQAFLRGPYRQYPFIFLFAIADFVTTALEMPFYLSYFSGHNFLVAFGLKTRQSVEDKLVNIYWADEIILHVMVYAVVISLLYGATAKLQSRKVVRLLLIGGAILFAAVSGYVHYNPHTPRMGEWMTPWSAQLNFSSAILDLALWALLISSRTKDHRLLMVSGGLGIQFTGEAIGGSLRNLAQGHQYQLTVYIGDTFVVLTNLVFLYILWQTFRANHKRNQAQAAA